MELMALLKEFSLNPIWPVITLNLRFNIALERGTKWAPIG